MAKIKLGPTVIGIRGTIGGITFSANKSGPNARAWSRGSNPQANLQAAARGRLAAIPELWRALTVPQHDAWDAFALLPAQELFDSLGESFFGSGFLWFTKCNTRLLTIGRPTIAATPVIARPSAPTITSLQLPFLDAQYAKITYPSGQFPPSTDQIIELAIARSTGATIAPSSKIAIKETQSPPDVDSGFIVPYLDRIGPSNQSMKGFASVYGQTVEGIRSSAGTVSFVSTDSPPYVATAKDYDGLNNFALRGADLTGNANSKIALISVWFRVDAGNGTTRYIQSASLGRIALNLTTANTLRLTVFDTSPAIALQVDTVATFLSGSAWHNVIISFDLSNSTVQIAVDGSLQTPNIIQGPFDVLVDWTRADHSIGALIGGTLFWDGCLAEFYFNNTARVDLEQPNALRLFVSPDGSPMDLGANGSFPTNSQPIVYTRAADPAVNLGSGGNYVNQAPLFACSTTP